MSVDVEARVLKVYLMAVMMFVLVIGTGYCGFEKAKYDVLCSEDWVDWELVPVEVKKIIDEEDLFTEIFLDGEIKVNDLNEWCVIGRMWPVDWYEESGK